MKTSINYLPEQKRDDLRRIVECVLEVLPDCEMIILYGSYARNTSLTTTNASNTVSAPVL